MTTLRIGRAPLLIGGALLAIAGLASALIWMQRRPDPVPDVPETDIVASIVAKADPADPHRIRFPDDQAPSLSLPDGSRETVHSLLKIAPGMRYGDYVWNDRGVPEGPVWIRVDLRRQMLSVFRAGHEIGAAVILYGVGRNPTPTGIFPILARAKVHRSSIYDADMPYMLRLTGDGVAIHATHVRADLASRGCIGVPLPFAQDLFAAARVGDRVVILPEARNSNKKLS